VATYLVPVILGVVAILVFVPIVVAAANYPNFVNALASGAIVGGTVIVVVAITLWVGILAGQANMNKKAVLTGKTSFSDFSEGFRKYFARILGGNIVLFLIYLALTIYLLLLFIGVGLVFPPVPPTIPTAPPTIQDITRTFLEVRGDLMAVPMAVWLDALRLIARYSVVALSLAIVSFLVYVFTLPWIQACVIEDVGVLKAIRTSVGFVAKNFYTIMGYLGLYIIAIGFTSSIFLGSGIPTLPFTPLTGGRGFGIAGLLGAASTLLIMTFFTLLLYVVYAGRTGKLVTAKPKPPSTPPAAFRSIKRE